ncbi:hypothetical protein [Xenorhabdus bovienii]|uniref:hypothetical protein n=1 Tax=Xenorhabdus bovienii TaxID=40576 RepID=UPI00237C950E|nr:hypothetical protein [Xenorhabdus bovienii]MDE1483921.1 hypothetical protein [Xenorhabdus bovienii]MDE9459328.1 hypothetical protein [Xenorhabdus bovienii]MDE9515521.1 hypothetical protein [Xenorhabdus bovienii]
MSKDVIELAKQLKQLAIDVKFERYDFVWLQNHVKDDWGQDTIPAKYFAALSNYHQIITLCEAVEKLTAYKNADIKPKFTYDEYIGLSLLETLKKTT